MTPDQYCQDKAARSGSSFYYSFLFLPPERRQAIIALYAFCREVDDVVDEVAEESVARVKLQWWRDEIARTFQGAPQHPVTRALATAIERYDLAEEHFLEIIDGMEMDLDRFSYDSFKELSLYCYRVASVVGLMSAQIFGYSDRHTLKYAHDLGIALQLTNIIRDVREDAQRGRIYLPLDELARFGVTVDDILNYRSPQGFVPLMRHQAERAHHYYEQAFAQLPEEDRATQRSGIIMATIYRRTLEEIEADGFRVMEHRVSLTPLHKLWLAWRTARGERKRFKKWRTARQAP